MKRFIMRPLVMLLCASGVYSLSSQAMASAFQIWEQDGASTGNYHAGYAAEANDASIAWYNPAGIPRIQNQQLVIGSAVIVSDFKYKGNIGVTERSPVFTPDGIMYPYFTQTFTGVTAQGGTFNVVPSLHYVAPISDWIGFGFSVDVPFGLKTSYGASTPVRYAATFTSINVIDISPSIGFRISDKASLGVGFDIQRAFADFNSYGGLFNPFEPKVVLPEYDSQSNNEANDTGYGFRLGWLYDYNPNTRVGISYHSQVVHHLTGTSKLTGPIADTFNHGEDIISEHAKAGIKLPPYTALTVFHKPSPQWALMGTLIYTQWNTFKTLSLQNAAGVVNTTDPEEPVASSTNIEVNIPENYHNSWSASFGANYYPTDTIILRTGIGYDQTPVSNNYRNIQLPDASRYALSLGAHFQATKTIGIDAGWAHIFFLGKVNVNPPAQTVGAQIVNVDGNVRGGADVLTGQITWDIF